MRSSAAAALTLLLAAVPAAAQFTSPTVFVVRITTSDNSVVIRNTPAGAATVLGTDIVIPGTGSGALTINNSSTSEGALTVSPNGQYLGFAGYRTGTAGSGTDRVIGRFEVTTGTVNTVTAIPGTEGYTGSSIRSAVWSDTGGQFWAAGTTSGSNGGTRTGTFQSTAGSIQVSTTPTNTRVVGINNGQLYASAMSGAFVGLNAVGSGTPTTTGNTTTNLPGTNASGTGTPSPYGFALSPNGLTLYLADDRSATNGGGIQKWTRPDTTSTFSLATTFTTNTGSSSTAGARGVAVDFTTTNPTVYATTADGTANRFVSFVDNGGVAAAFVTLDTAGTGTVYRGVAFSPVPEPAMGLVLAAFGSVVIRRRSRAGRHS